MLDNLSTPEATNNLSNLLPQERETVINFIHSKALPNHITDNLIQGLQGTLQGLEKVVIDSNEFLLALTKPGMPCTPDQLDARIRTFLQEQLHGKDPRKTRIQIDW